MQDLSILKNNVKASREKAQEFRVKLRVLKEQCRHPKALICYSPMRTWCAACDKTLWSSTGDSFYSDQAHLSVQELQNISATHSRIKLELDVAEKEIREFEGLCPHPDSLVEQSPALGIGHDDECGVCGKDWSEVQAERNDWCG